MESILKSCHTLYINTLQDKILKLWPTTDHGYSEFGLHASLFIPMINYNGHEMEEHNVWQGQ